MRVSSFAPLAPWLAAAGVGCVVSLAVRLSTDLFAGGPLALVVGAAVGLGSAGVVPKRRAARAALATLAAGLVLAAAPIARAFVWLGGYPALPLLGAGLGIVVVTGLRAPLHSAVARAGRGAAGLGVAAFAAATWLDPLPLVATILALGAAALLGETAHEAARDVGPTWRERARRVAGALPVAVLVLGAWALGRGALDPTPLGFVALGAGMAAGALLSRGAWGIGAGAALGVAVAWAGVERLPDVLGAHRYAGTAALAALGLGAGPAFGALRLDRPSAAVVLGLAALVLPRLLGALPPDIAARVARADAASATSMERAADLRARATLAWEGVGPTGASAVYRLDDRVFTELEGGLYDPATRAGAAERFAGTLAACATAGRTRARVAGDDLGLAVEALRAQGFLAIDTALPDGGLVRAQAAAVPALSRGWLHPSVRIVTLPGPSVLRAGPTADVVVQIARAPFTDARQAWPDVGSLRAIRGGLAAGGVYVLAVATTTLGEPGLRALLHDLHHVFPHGSLWLPPEGADTALFLGPLDAAPLAWSGFERCVAADPKGLAAQSLRSAVEVGTLALADAPALAASPAGRASGPGLPASLRQPPSLPLAAFAGSSADPAVLFAGAPNADLAARAASRTLLLEMLREATGGDVRDAFARARTLAAAPGGARALEPVVRPTLARAKQAMQRGKQEGVTSKAWAEAEAAIGTARALAPTHAPTRCLEGELAGERGQLARAEESFAACIELDPTSLYGHDGLARSRRSRGDRIGEEAALRGGLAARPDAWTTASNLGYFLLELGRVDEAERLLKQAVATQSRTSGAQEAAPYLALAQLYLSTDRPELALAQAQRASTLKPNPDALALRGAARFELRQLAEAEDDFRAALALRPSHVMARGGLGRVQATRGEYELAAASFQAALAEDPDNALARQNLELLGPRLKAATGP